MMRAFYCYLSKKIIKSRLTLKQGICKVKFLILTLVLILALRSIYHSSIFKF